MRVETLLCSIIDISKSSYEDLRINAVRAGYKITECENGNEKLEYNEKNKL